MTVMLKSIVTAPPFKWPVEHERASRAAETRAVLQRVLRVPEATSVHVAMGLPHCGWVGSLARALMVQQGAWNSPRARWLFRMARDWSERRMEAKAGIPSLTSPPAWRAKGRQGPNKVSLLGKPPG